MGPEAETTGECCLLECMLLLACSASFLIHPGPPVVGMVPPTVGRALPHLFSIKKMSQCDGDIFSADVPSSQVTPICVELMETATKQDILQVNSYKHTCRRAYVHMCGMLVHVDLRMCTCVHACACRCAYVHMCGILVHVDVRMCTCVVCLCM